jgi:hypothetical protein
VGAFLQAAPLEAWFALFGTIVGALIAVLGVWLNNRSSARLLRMQLQHALDDKERDATRQRREQLYVECRRYFGDVVSYFLPYRAVMEGRLTFNEALDMTINRESPRERDPHHVFMLVDFYFPEFRSDLQEITGIRDRLNEIVHGFKERYGAGDTDGSRWLTIFQPEFESLGQKMEAFEALVADCGPVSTI